MLPVGINGQGETETHLYRLAKTRHECFAVASVSVMAYHRHGEVERLYERQRVIGTTVRHDDDVA